MKTSQYRSIMMVCWLAVLCAASSPVAEWTAFFFNIAYATGYAFAIWQESKP